MAQYPVTDEQGLYESVNFLLAGPGGLGQNFAGFSSYTPGWVTGNYRIPYSQTALANLYVAPIACSSAVQLDDRTFQYNFSAAQVLAPFSNGNNIAGSGWTNDFYNGGQGVIGVITCTTEYVIFRTNGYYPGIGTDSSGGSVYWNAIVDGNGDPKPISTDCNARVTVTSATDRVFISAQLDDVISYATATGGDLTYIVQINRYIGSINNDPINPDYIFDFDQTVAEKSYSRPGLTGTGTLAEIETIFSTVIDRPPPAYYWYILEVTFVTTGDLKITTAVSGLRSLSAQVVKQ